MNSAYCLRLQPSPWFLIVGLIAGCTTTPPRPAIQGTWPTTTVLTDVEQRVGLPYAAWPGADQHPTADALDLVRARTVRLLPDGTVTIREHRVTKILTERGKQYSQITIPFDAQLQMIELRWAQTIQPDGKIVPISRDAVSSVAPFQALNAFSSTHVMIISMPAVGPGSVLDWGYEVTTKPSLMGNHLWDGVLFSDGHPVLRASYTVTVPAAKSLRWHASGVPQAPSESRGPAGVSYTWKAESLGSIELDPEGPPLREVLPWVSVSTVPSWEAVAQWWRQIAMLRVSADEPIVQWVEKRTAGLSSQKEKLRVIFEDLQKEVRYVALEFGRGGYEPHWAHEVFLNRYGDCKDQTVLLLAMLQVAGIKAGPALIRTASFGPLAEDTPSPGEFNHAIVWAEADGQEFWLDPSSGSCPFGEIPLEDAEVKTLLIVPGGSRLQATPSIDPQRHLTTRTVSLQLQENGTFQGKVSYKIQGWPSVLWRLTAQGMKPEQMETMTQKLAKDIATQATIVERHFPDWQAIDPSVEFSLTLEAQNWATPLEERLVLIKLPVAMVSPRGLNKAKRKNSWWWGVPESFQDHFTVELPQNYRVHTLPKRYRYEDANCALEATWTQAGQRLVFERVIVFKKRAVASADWEDFRAAFLAFEQAAAQPVLLRR